MPDLKSMQYFVQVAELGSFSRAADALRLTQPAVSRLVRKLENEVGIPLLYRKGREVAPTEAGRVLLLRAKELDRQAKGILDDVRAGSGKPTGSLAVGVATVVGYQLLPAAIEAFSSQFPDVRLRIAEGNSGFVEDWLQQGRVDVGLVWGRPRSTAVDIIPLMTMPMCLIAPPKPLAPWESDRPLSGRHCSMDDVVRLPLFLPALPHSLRLLVESAAQQRGASLNVAAEVDGLMLANEMVRRGLGYTLMTPLHPLDFVEGGDVRTLPIGLPEVPWVLFFATLKGTRNSAAIREFMNCVRTECGEKIRRGELVGKLVKH